MQNVGGTGREPGAGTRPAENAPVTAGLFIGSWRVSERRFSSPNPASPREVIAEFAAAQPEDVELAVAAAKEAAPAWRATPAAERARLLYRTAELLESSVEQFARGMAREMGKPIRDGEAEVHRSVAILRYFAGECMQPVGEVYPPSPGELQLLTTRHPIGVVAAITPWNFPLAIPTWKLAPALAFGNTVVFKPAEPASLTAVQLVETLLAADLPSGVVSLITGHPGDLGDSLIAHRDVDAISFTGSNAAGSAIATKVSPLAKKLQLELGGKNAAVVLADADRERAAAMIARGAMLLTGQRCTATSRAIVVDDVYDDLVERIVDRVAALNVGDPLGRTTDIGPLATSVQHEKVARYLELARDEGLHVALDGDVADPSSGYWITPTVLTDVPPESRLAHEEVFGPVLAMMRARDADHALELANATDYGLSASVFTSDLRSAITFAEHLDAGVVHVNGETGGAEPHVPFGGMKASSSHSREQGKAASDFFTDIKTVYVAA